MSKETKLYGLNKESILQIRMDKKLRLQLEKYADKNDEGNISLSARRAIKKFLEEQL